MSENYITNTESDDWKENEEGILELQFDPSIVESNIEVIEEDLQANITYGVPGKIELGGEDLSQSPVYGYADINTGEIIRLSSNLSANAVKEAAKENIKPFSMKVAFSNPGNRTVILSINSVDFNKAKEKFSDQAQINLKKTVDEFNRVKKEKT